MKRVTDGKEIKPEPNSEKAREENFLKSSLCPIHYFAVSCRTTYIATKILNLLDWSDSDVLSRSCNRQPRWFWQEFGEDERLITKIFRDPRRPSQRLQPDLEARLKKEVNRVWPVRNGRGLLIEYTAR